MNSAWFCSGSDGEVYSNLNEFTVAISNRSHLGNLTLKTFKEHNFFST